MIYLGNVHLWSKSTLHSQCTLNWRTFQVQFMKKTELIISWPEYLHLQKTQMPFMKISFPQ